MSERKLTESEFKEILQRAADLDMAEKREFTDTDLQDAARELGLSPTALSAAKSEYLAHLALEGKPLAEPRPFDTKLDVQSTPSAFSLTVPPLGVRFSTLGPLASSLIILAFMAFWTFMAARGSILFAMFSIPGWIAGLRSLARSFAQLTMRTELALTRRAGLLIRRIGPFAHRVDLDPEHAFSRLDAGTTNTENSTTREPFLTLHHGTRTYKLLEGYLTSEQEWVHAELQRWQGKS